MRYAPRGKKQQRNADYSKNHLFQRVAPHKLKYIYVIESGLYYLQSRYYDPDIGRFINADNQIAGVGGEVLGYNMFAYCFNNPVNMTDPSGNWPLLVKRPKGWWYSGTEFGANLFEDLANYKRENTDVNNVYAAHYFSSYKGVFVFRHSSNFLTSWSSNNSIKLNHNLDSQSSEYKTRTLNHEYGHALQEQEMGALKYFAAVFVPSATFNLISRFNPTINILYYSLPWEDDADRRGSVKRENKHWLAESWSWN